MKRTEINAIIREADDFIRSHGFHLPPFAHWTPDEWKAKGPEVREIVDRKLGWDVTDFNLGEYRQTGLLLFTIRNGNVKDPESKQYAEKIMMVDIDQITPMHFHWHKTEDIINRGGGNLVIQLYNAMPDERLGDSSVAVSVDGVRRTVPAGGKIVLTPGESITLVDHCYHEFWAEGSRVLAGEVSLVNDDTADNRFYRPVGRFPEIEEDAAPLFLLTKDYSRYTTFAR